MEPMGRHDLTTPISNANGKMKIVAVVNSERTPVKAVTYLGTDSFT